jgi:hypothetical protein
MKTKKEVKYLRGFESARSLCEFQCLKCSTHWTTRAGRVLADHECPQCSDQRRGHNRRKSHPDFLAELKSIAPDIKCLGQYTTAREKLQFKHSCGTTWYSLPRNILQGNKCPTCAKTMKTATLGKRVVSVRGYEPQGLKLLIATGIKPKDITVYNEGGVPFIRYKLYGSQRVFYPDFFIKSKRKIVEVKSLATLGLTKGFYDHKPSFLFAMMKAKAKASVAQGYKFELLLLSASGDRIKLPKDWTTLSRRAAMSVLGL